MFHWCLKLLLISAITLRVYGQVDNHGFLSIDCGIPANSTTVDVGTNFTYVSDDQFIETGNNSQISPSYVTNSLLKEFLTVRYFPTGNRNCYTIRSLIVGYNYLVRALFYYGNYDNRNKPPVFDVYLGVNFWYTVNASSPSYPEIFVNTTTDYLQVCLVNKGSGIPFISSLHLRQFKKGFTNLTSTELVISLWRFNLGASNHPLLRWPDDKYDRWWWSYSKQTWIEISTNSTVSTDSDYETPSAVLQTAVTTSSTLQPLIMNWTGDTTSKYYYLLHFAEIQATSTTNRREFNISARGYLMAKGYNPPHSSDWWGIWDWGVADYSVALQVTSNSTLPPLMNAIELYKLVPVGGTTNESDITAINSIATDHKIKKGWSGDPCLPQDFKWTGIDCTNSSGTMRITGLKLSYSGLTGQLSEYFGKLIALQSLDLSNNDLSGYLPSSLGQLTDLSFLDIRGNGKLNTTLPSGLQNKVLDGSLIYRYDIKPNPSPPNPAPKKNIIIIAIAVAVPLLIIAAAIATVFWLKRRKYNQPVAPKPHYELNPIANDPARTYENIPQGDNPWDNYSGQAMTNSLQSKGAGQVLPKFEKRQFSYYDIKRITDGFQKIIGTGGYGNVYLGLLENRFQVAVKMRSHTSAQGEKEFLAEAENLTRVHHKNLVSLLGYCIDKNCMALVYEYMQEGNLLDKLKDNARPLAWMQRLRIAYGSALGLEYLHMACNPPLIHRDVKTSNILLNANLEAKIADFGLSKAFNNDAKSPLSTRVVGTLGYLDPEYYTLHQLSEKSDVFSFGVVLLEIVTGRPPIITGTEGGNLVEWVHRKLSIGDIKSIVDPRIQEKYDVNSVWKVTELACKCTEYASSRRPTMTVVAAELKESLDLELSSEGMHDESAIELVTDVSQDALSEMAYMAGMTKEGPAVR